MSKNKQLYRLFPDMQFPHLVRYDEETGKAASEKETVPGYYAVIWPNGEPCLLAEMFLLERAKNVKISKKDGGTVGGYARHISHLIRFCYANNKEFWDLSSSDFVEFINVLSSEKNEFNRPCRDNNTIKSILASNIIFLKWMQDHIVRDRDIVGVDTETKRYQVKLIRKTEKDSRGRVYTHEVFSHNLPASISREKTPISMANIKRLWSALEEKSISSKCSRKLEGIFSDRQQKDHLEFMQKRRELQLYLLESTGLRPQELITIQCRKNIQYLKESKILLPTLKRREGAGDSVRLVPIDRSIAMKIEVFIHKYRKKLVNRLLNVGLVGDIGDVDDVIYLNSETGKAVKPDAAYQEFRRLSIAAKISQKCCQSMFRHRFITNMVKLHLISFMDKNPLKTRHIITSDDYRAILFKVTKFTGHKDPNSLFHYIDLAWEEMDVFSNAYDIKSLQDKLMSVFHSLSTLKLEISKMDKKGCHQLVRFLTNKIEDIEKLTIINADD